MNHMSSLQLLHIPLPTPSSTNFRVGRTTYQILIPGSVVGILIARLGGVVEEESVPAECADHLAEDVLALDGGWLCSCLTVLQEFSNAIEPESMTSNLFGAPPPFVTAESCPAVIASDLDRAWGEMACFAENYSEVAAHCGIHAAMGALGGEEEVQEVAVVQMRGDRRQSKIDPQHGVKL